MQSNRLGRILVLSLFFLFLSLQFVSAQLQYIDDGSKDYEIEFADNKFKLKIDDFEIESETEFDIYKVQDGEIAWKHSQSGYNIRRFQNKFINIGYKYCDSTKYFEKGNGLSYSRTYVDCIDFSPKFLNASNMIEIRKDLINIIKIDDFTVTSQFYASKKMQYDPSTPDVTTGLIGNWTPINNCTYDHSGNGNHGTNGGGVTWVANATPYNRHACYYDGGATADIAIGSVFPSSNFTKLALVARNSTGTNENILSASGTEHTLWVPGGKFVAGYNGNNNRINDGVTLAIDDWYFVAVTYNNGNLTLWRNGTKVGSATGLSDLGVNTNFWIGAYDGSYNWEGWIGDVYVYDRALNTTEMEYLMNESFTASSGIGDGTPPPAQEAEVNHTACFGDSITYGTNIGANNTYCRKINATLNYTTYNYGHEAKTSEDLESTYMSDVLGKNYNFTILLIGTNDIRYSTNTTHEVYYNNLLNITQQIKDDEQQVLISTIPPCNHINYNCSTGDQSEVINRNDIIRRVSYQKNLCYVDIFETLFQSDYNLSQFWNNDGLHPTAQKHSEMNSSYISALESCTSFNCDLNPDNCYNFSVPAAPACSQLATPSGLTNTTQDNESITINWNTVSGAEKYLIFVDGTNTVNDTAPTTILSGLSPETLYCINLTAFNSTCTQAQSNVSNTICVSTLVNSAPPAPSINISSFSCNPSNDSIVLSWTTIGNYSYSELRREGSLVYNSTTKSFEDTGLTNATTYQYNLTVYYNLTVFDSQLKSCTTDQNTSVGQLTTTQALYGLAIAILLLGSLAILFYIGSSWDFVIFKRSAVDVKRTAIVLMKDIEQKSVMQVLIYAVGLWMLLLPLQLAIFLAELIGTNYAELVRIIYWAMGFLNIIISMFLVAFLTFNMMIWLGVDVVKVFNLGKRQ